MINAGIPYTLPSWYEDNCVPNFLASTVSVPLRVPLKGARKGRVPLKGARKGRDFCKSLYKSLKPQSAPEKPKAVFSFTATPPRGF